MSLFFLKLLGGGHWLFSLLGKLWGKLWDWMLSDWRNGPLLGFAIGFAAFAFWKVPALQSDLTTARVGLKAEKNAHAETVENYRLAAVQAKQMADANVDRVKAQQDAITEEIVDDYQKRLIDARSRAAELIRLREQFAADHGSTHAIDLPGTGIATSGADEAPGDSGLPDDPESGSIRTDIEWRLIATEQALQLDALIDWNEAQEAVEFNGELND